MSQPIRQSNFAGGEISPLLYGRTDHVKYESGVRTLRNMISTRHGPATQRPGTMYVGTTQNGGNPVRLIPFIFNETGNGQSYVLEFGNLYVGFYQNGGVVVSGGNPYTIVSPYAQADLASLKFDESADVITITHPSYPVYELKRGGALSWTLTQVTFGSKSFAPSPQPLTGTASAGFPSFVYYMTTIQQVTGEESLAASIASTNLAFPSSTTPVTLTWNNPLSGFPAYYNIYRAPTTNTAGGFIGQIAAAAGSFIDTGITANFALTPPISNTVFGGAGDYPSCVAYIQQRRALGGTNNNPVGFWLSQPGFYANFNTHASPVASDAVIASLAGNQVNLLEHILELKFMLALTAGAEIFLQGNGTGIVTPGAVNASTQSQYGAGTLRPLRIADTAIFCQALGNSIRDLTYDFAINGYRGNDLTVFSSHLFEGFSLVDWDFQKIPDSIVWAARNDGLLLGMTYMREQQVLGWHHHDFTNGTVENVCAIPENGAYAVYFCIKRVINGATVRYIERLSSRIWSDVVNATYLDCFSSYNGVNATATTMTLSVPSGGTFQNPDPAGTAYQQSLNLMASAAVFTPTMVGDQFFLSDANFVSAQGNVDDPENPAISYALSIKGNQVRCTVMSYISPTQVMVTPNRMVPATLQNTPVASWAHAVQTVSGLGYLAGQQVSVWADRFVVGSPLNTEIQTVYTVPANGILTLDKPYSVIYVGLPMIADLQTLDIETVPGFVEALLGKRKRTNKLAVYVQNSRTLFAGSENPDSNPDNTLADPLFQMFELEQGISRKTYDQPPELHTDQETVFIDTRWNKNGRIFIRNVDPVPLTILAVVPAGDSPSPTPYGKRV